VGTIPLVELYALITFEIVLWYRISDRISVKKGHREKEVGGSTCIIKKGASILQISLEESNIYGVVKSHFRSI